MAESNNSPSSRWAELRDFCAAIRELLVVVAIGLLLLTPASVRSVLERAGVRSVAGVEFDAKSLNEAQTELNHAQQQMEELRTQLVAAQQQLNRPAAPSAFSATAADPRNGDVSRILSQMQSKLDDTENSLHRSKRLHERAFSGQTIQPLEDQASTRTLAPLH